MTNRLLDPRLIAHLGHPKAAPGDEYRFLCPFCPKDDSSGHLYFNSKTGLWKCQRCDAKGNRFGLYRLLGIPFDEEPVPVPDDWSDAIHSLMDGGKTLTLPSTDDGYVYCDPPTVCPGPLGLRAFGYLSKRGVSPEDMVDYEIKEGAGKLGERIVFIERETIEYDSPILVWVARAYTPELINDCKRYPDRVRRYEHPKGVKKSQGVFNLVRVEGPSVIVTEGCFDAIAAGKTGVATYGKSPSDRQKDRLLLAGFTDYYVAYDPEALHESLELCHWFSSYNRRAHVVVMPLGEDPSSLGKQRFADCLSAAILYEPFETMAELLRRGVVGRNKHVHHRTPESETEKLEERKSTE